MRYWDSSAMVPLLAAEASSAAMQQLLAADAGMLTWWSTAIECASALSRLEREGSIELGSVREAFRRLHVLQDAWHEITPTESVRDVSIRLLRVHDLRAADAMQLAAAWVASEGKPGALPFVCLDARLSRAAEKEGFEVVGAA